MRFEPLVEPTQAISDAFTRWENDQALVHLSRPNRSQEELEARRIVTIDELAERIVHGQNYLILLDGHLVGEMSYQLDPAHLFTREPGTAWISITIGEAHGRGKGVGRQALRYLEQQIAAHSLKRIELGVFEFNAPALALYRKAGYGEIGRLPDFTYWQGRMWHDIRMEKRLDEPVETR
jgi:RimJ/RimL family protein N-acetyltransferase